MYQELKYVDSADAIAEHEQKWGNHNAYPPGWREISAAEYASAMRSYSPERIEYRQMMRDISGEQVEGPAACAHLFFYWNDTGVAAVWGRDYNGRRAQSTEFGKFYAFGCQHSYVELSPEEKRAGGYERGHCMHTVRCTKCGHVWTYDSSD